MMLDIIYVRILTNEFSSNILTKFLIKNIENKATCSIEKL